MKKVFLWLLVISMIAVFSLAGCKEEAAVEEEVVAEEAEEVATGEAEEVVIGFSFATLENVSYIAYQDFVRQNADENGARVIFTVAEGDVSKQQAQIEDLIAKKVDVIMAIPQDSKAIGSAIVAAKEAGIPFITYMRSASPELEVRPDVEVLCDTVHQAYSSGIALADVLEKDEVEAKALHVIGDLRDENAVNRSNGFKQAAEERGIEIIAEIPSEWNPEKALTGTANAFQANPEINTILLASDFLLPAVQSALLDLDRWYPRGDERHIYIASQDLFPSGYRMLRDGYMEANTEMPAWGLSEAAIEIAMKFAKGEKPDSPIFLIEGQVGTQENIETLENLWGKIYSE